MAETRYETLNAEIARAIEERPQRDQLYNAVKRARDSRRSALEALPGGAGFRKEVREIKLRCQSKQDALVDQFVQNLEKRGANVLLAKDGPEAIEYVLKLAAEKGARTCAKSKSLTTEEIEINHPMEDAGMEVIETDLGELIIQKVHEKPFHLVFPAVHKTAAQVAEIFRRETGEDVPNDVNEIMKVVRRYLRPIFLDADIGMTGANVGIADTGAIVIETNEGNARLVSSIPDVHICVMGREKIVESCDDAVMMLLAHPISAVGQHTTTYVTFQAGRSPLGYGEGREPRETHIIILDNGRTEMAKDPLFSDALNCIRCGACMNICPTYGVVGGHTFGHIYPGPIGIPWTSEVHGLELAGDFAPLCISCGLCKEICPAEIDIPMMIAGVKDRDAETHPHPRVNRFLMDAERGAKMGSMTAPFSNWMMRSRPFRYVLEKVVGIDRRRNLPVFRRNTLEKRLKRRERSPVKDPKRKVAFFADIFANYSAPELGMAAVEHLERLGCDVVYPDQVSSGYPSIGYGDLAGARKTARENVSHLKPWVDKGYHIVTTEPTAAYCLCKSYPKLLDEDPDAIVVAKNTTEFFEFVDGLEENIGKSLAGRRFGFHIPCHQRPLGEGGGAIAFLQRRGAEIEVIETGTCCGMGGTFGLKKGQLGYELANAVGEPLFDGFRESGVEAIVTESSVCSIHIGEGTGIEVWHPLMLVGEVGGR